MYPHVGVDKDLTIRVGPYRYGDESTGTEAVISGFYFLFNLNNEAMSKKHNGVNYSKTIQKQSRRRRAIQSLEAQLKAGTKTQKGTMDSQVLLTEKDTKRIQKEIENLKAKL